MEKHFQIIPDGEKLLSLKFSDQLSMVVLLPLFVFVFLKLKEMVVKALPPWNLPKCALKSDQMSKDQSHSSIMKWLKNSQKASKRTNKQLKQCNRPNEKIQLILFLEKIWFSELKSCLRCWLNFSNDNNLFIYFKVYK